MRETLACHICFTTYGTWLHGDERGSWDGHSHKPLPTDPLLRKRRERQLKHPAVTLTREMRAAVDAAIREVCEHRQRPLLALNVRTNHVHVAVRPAAPASKMLHDFKAYATRRLRELNLVSKETQLWTAKGGIKGVYHPDGVSDLVHYILHGQ